jgi:thioredoxin reductase (NADPH)
MRLHNCLGEAMLTIDDIRAIPLFSTLSDNELEHAAHASADLQLSAGEFAVHEGGERALYAVLAGKLEVIKTFDGVRLSPVKRVASAVGEGSMAIAFAHKYLQHDARYRWMRAQAQVHLA